MTNLTIRYILALTLIAVSVLILSAYVSSIVQSQKEDARIINIGGQQRMLSQRIAFFANEYVITLSQNLQNKDNQFHRVYVEQLKGEILKSAHQMEQNLEILTKGNASLGIREPKSPSIQRIYFEPPFLLEKKVRDYIQNARSVVSTKEIDIESPSYTHIIVNGPTHLVFMLDRVVQEYERISRNKTSNLQKTIIFAVVFILALIVAEALLIFKPMVRATESKLKELNKINYDLDRATKLKSDFLATMSHEIRTPMNGVLGMASLMMETKLTEQQKHYMKTISSSAESLLQILNDILDFSKIEADKLVFKNTNFSVVQAIENVVSVLRFSAEKKKITLYFDNDTKEDIFLYGDRNRFEQVLYNLVSNAIKFTEKGHVKIHIDEIDLSSSFLKTTLKVSVSDTGVGVPKEKIDIIFDKFSQADFSIAREYEGTGLGLAICQKLVELMDGKIGVESEIGKGSTFWFTISLPKARYSSEDDIFQSKSTARKDFSGVKVLLVEDNMVNKEISEKMLQDLGCEVVWVENGQKATEAAHSQKFDIIFMDVHMPLMDGIQATKILRGDKTQDYLGYVPIIALTANVMKESIDSYLAVGMNDHIPKPTRKEDFIRILNKYCTD